jgi:hypothetical protein
MLQTLKLRPLNVHCLVRPALRVGLALLVTMTAGLAAGYSFVRDAQKEFGATLGLHATDFEMTIAAAGITGCSAVSASARPTATSTTT